MRKVIIAILIGAGLILLAVAMGMCASLFKVKRIYAGDGVALVRITGGIFTADEKVGELEDVRKDSSIKAVVIRIDSPGGAVAASQEIYAEVKRVDAEKPVVVSMGDVAASGAYYISCGARRIFANPGTITGSIGVRMEHVNLKELFSWAKIGHETLKTGEFKDLASPDRPLTEKERLLLQGVLSEMHRQFKDAVASARNMDPGKIDEIADGRIYTGETALKLGLIDELGGLTDAVKTAGELAGIKGEPEVIEIKPRRPWWFDIIVEKFHQYLAVYKM